MIVFREAIFGNQSHEINDKRIFRGFQE